MEVRPALLALNLPFNLSGWPAVSVPAPVDAADGLPVGVQVVGVRLEERGVLRVAAAIEARARLSRAARCGRGVRCARLSAGWHC